MDSMIIATHLLKTKTREQRRRDGPQVLDQAAAGFRRSMLPVAATFAGIAAFATVLTFA